MVKICENFAKKMNLKLSTHSDPKRSKTKCIIFSPHNKVRVNIAPIILNADPLPWEKEVKHLGNIMQCENNMKQDIAIKEENSLEK